jgi:hypothetical protein
VLALQQPAAVHNVLCAADNTPAAAAPCLPAAALLQLLLWQDLPAPHALACFSAAASGSVPLN